MLLFFFIRFWCLPWLHSNCVPNNCGQMIFRAARNGQRETGIQKRKKKFNLFLLFSSFKNSIISNTHQHFDCSKFQCVCVCVCGCFGGGIVCQYKVPQANNSLLCFCKIKYLWNIRKQVTYARQKMHRADSVPLIADLPPANFTTMQSKLVRKDRTVCLDWSSFFDQSVTFQQMLQF